MHKVVKALETVMKRSSSTLTKIGLEYFSSPNYVGLFLEDCAADFLRKLSLDFAMEVANVAGRLIGFNS